MGFTGFPPAAFTFYEQLAGNNTKAWWQDNKSTYEQAVRAPMTELLTALEPEFGAFKVYRPYRDARFSKDKTPIKDHQGAVVMIEDGVGYYVQVSAAGLMVGGGLYAPAPRQLARMRAAIDSPACAILEGELSRLGRARPSWDIDGAPLKTRPKGVAADHPRLELLRMTRLIFTRSYADEAMLSTTRALTTVRRDWRAIAPAIEWLADHAGPAEDPGLD